MPQPTPALFLIMFIPFWPQWTTSSRIMHLITKLKSCQCVHCTQMVSKVTVSQANRAPSGGGTGDSRHGCEPSKSAATVSRALMSMWLKISEECLHHFVESVSRRNKHFWEWTSIQLGSSGQWVYMWVVIFLEIRSIRGNKGVTPRQ